MRKTFLCNFLLWLIFLTIMGCTSSKYASSGIQADQEKQADVKQADDMMINIPYKTDSNGSTWNWQFFYPSVPADVPSDIYSKLWDINLKTIKAGKYDYNVLNVNTAQSIKYDESALSDDFTFEGVYINYVNYFLFLLNHDTSLQELLNNDVITVNTNTSHKWLEYHTERNRYIIDPTWCDWDYIGEPVGIYAGNAEFAEACRTSHNRDKLIEAKSREWFFRNVKTVTRDSDRQAYNL